MLLDYNGPLHKKTRLQRFGKNKGIDQPAHTHSLIKAFVIHLLESIISWCARSEISIFSLAEQAGLNLTLLETTKTGFLAYSPNNNIPPPVIHNFLRSLSTLCSLGNFSCFFVVCWFFQKVSNSLNPDQTQHFVSPDLGPNCLQRLWAENTSR